MLEVSLRYQGPFRGSHHAVYMCGFLEYTCADPTACCLL